MHNLAEAEYKQHSKPDNHCRPENAANFLCTETLKEK